MVLFCLLSCSESDLPKRSQPLAINYLNSQQKLSESIILELSSSNGKLAEFRDKDSRAVSVTPDGVLNVSSEKKDIFFETLLKLNGDSYNKVEIILSGSLNGSENNNKSQRDKVDFSRDKKVTSNQLSFHWQGEHDHSIPSYKQITQIIKPLSSQWQSYQYILSENPFWKGQINKIAFHFANTHCNLRVKSIRFLFDKSQEYVSPFTSRIRIGDETRPATLLTIDGNYSCTAIPGRGSTLNFGISPYSMKKFQCPTNQTFEIFVHKENNSPVSIFEKPFNYEDNSSGNPVWHDFTVDLSSYQGVPISISFNQKKPERDDSYRDCYLALSTPYIFQPPLTTRHKNMILVSIDTLRADHLGCYGYPVHTSPWIDYISRKGVTAAQSITPYPSTAPAHISLMTGLFPSQHGVLKGKNRLGFFVPTLAESLIDNNYFTGAITGGGNVSAFHRIDKGFHSYDDSERSVKSLHSKLIPWLNKHYNKPFFMFYHTYEVHAPFFPHFPQTEYYYPDYQGRIRGDELLYKGKKLSLNSRDRDYLVALYDSGIRYTDSKFKKLLSVLDTHKLSNSTYLLILSDHGEHFAEHGLYGHGNSLFSSLIEIPLIIMLPEKQKSGSITDSLINLIDIPVTVCSLLDIPLAKNFPGTNITPVLQNSSFLPLKQTFCELRSRTDDRKNWIDSFSFMDENYKFILELPLGHKKLYPRHSLENENDLLSSQLPEKAKDYQQKLQEILTKFNLETQENLEGQAPVDQQTERLLKVLGYLD